MPRTSWISDHHRLLAASQHGVIRVAELVRLGVPEITAYRRCLDGGPWQRPLPGIAVLHHGLMSDRQCRIAALLHAGPGAVLTGVVACRLHGLRRLPTTDEVHVLIAAHRQVRSSEYVRIERTRHLPRALERDGLPVAPLARAVIDAVRHIPQRPVVAALLTEPVQRRMILPEMLRAELDVGTRRGTATPRAVLVAAEAGVHSAAEDDARELWVDGDLGPVEWNVRLEDENGNFLAIVDAYVRGLGLAWEIDSVEEHFATPEQVLDTARRRRLLEEHGVYVVSNRPCEVRDERRGVQAGLRRAQEIAAGLPPPRVSAGPARFPAA